MLTWLDENRETAGQKYELIRAGLIKIFVAQGFSDAEDLADLTINRVCDRLPEIRPDYVGEPARYFHGVARNIIREARRRKEVATDKLPEHINQVVNTTDQYDCLLKCLKLLTEERRDLILDYYLYEGHDKIEHHKRMAEQLSLTEGALRLRAHHIRVALEKCILQCTKELGAKQKRSWRALLKRRQLKEVPVGKQH